MFVCFSSWDSNFSLCEERNGQFNLAFGEERAWECEIPRRIKTKKVCHDDIFMIFVFGSVYVCPSDL
jgi:hypothetical protein